MRRIKHLEFNNSKKSLTSDVHFIEITFFDEEYERDFLRDFTKLFSNKFIQSALIHDLDISIELYKNYFSLSDYSLFEDDPTHPFISCSILDPQGIKCVIDNFGYYTLDAYLYWSKDGIDFKKMLPNTSDYFFMDCSELSIRQVLDLSLEIQVSEKVISELWDILKNWSIS